MKPTSTAEEALGVGRRRVSAGPCSARPSMISAKYRLKEERRKVLKISVAKLRRIEDPESSLHRSVLINNTVRRLQREARDDKRADPLDDSPVVLCQFYMPPTPRMLTSIDDEPLEARRRKRRREEEAAEVEQQRSSCPAVPSGEQLSSRRDGPQFSCGHHASMFGELQSAVVFHSLIASLES